MKPRGKDKEGVGGSSKEEDATCRIFRRKWLEKNKIYFETVTAVFLSLMAIIVAFASGRQTYRQTQLIALQTRIEKEKALPQFVVKATKELDKKTNYFKDDILSVVNKGGIVSNLKGNSFVFLRIEMTPKPGVSGSRKILMVPLTGYYSSSFYPSDGDGKVLVCQGYQNNRKAAKLEREFNDIANRKGWFGYISVKRYIYLKYRGLLNEEHRAIYFVEPIYGGKKLPFDVGEKLYARYQKSSANGSKLFFNKITAESLIELVFDESRVVLYLEKRR
jgi:hypothetical protein